MANNLKFLRVDEGSQGRTFYAFKVGEGSIKVELFLSTFPNALKAVYIHIYSYLYTYIIKVDKVGIVNDKK